ncbi:MAG TPA: YlxR family protein [Jatrophihabitans sp.]|nr:YlxR family protein [Jatrophihabitans sp.]
MGVVRRRTIQRPLRGRLEVDRHDDGVTPVRTCIGCRLRVPVTELLRVVAAPEVRSEPTGSSVREVLPDPRRRAGGRGAWLHPDAGCLALAMRRRAFGRALRCGDRLDPAPVARHLESNG